MRQGNYEVVVIDDDVDLLDVIRINLEQDFTVKAFTDPEVALTYLEGNYSDAIIMDYYMGKVRAPEVYQVIRSRKLDVPVLFLTGDHDLRLKIDCLDLGVTDVLHKPISSAELTAHVMNRIKFFKKKKPTSIKLKNLEVNLQDPRVLLGGKTISFTPKEFKLLCSLVQRPNEIKLKMDLVAKIWPNVSVADNNLDTHLSSIRKKIVDFPGTIKTIKGVGYVLQVSES